MEPLKAEIDLYMLGCGMSPIYGNENAQTEAETLFSKDDTQRITSQLRTIYTEILHDLIDRLLV